MASGLPRIALVGYTNAGKSTILNRMLALYGRGEEKEVLEKDMLFATLDTAVRRIEPGKNAKPFLLSDTVGFISNLPTTLVKAFRSTLEEALYADLLVIVSDLSSPNYRQQRETVFQVLSELGAGDKPILEALNKADRAKISGMIEPADAILISAKNGDGLESLKSEISRRIATLRHQVELNIPYAKGNVLSLIHERGQVLTEEYTDTGTKVVCLLDAALYQKVMGML